MLSVWVLMLFFLPPDTQFNRVEQALAHSDYQGALEYLAASDERNASWHLLASKAYDGLNDPAKAIGEAEEALKLDPKNPVLHVQLAQIFLSRNTPQAALEILAEAESFIPGVFLIHLGKGLALKELQRYDAAEQEFQWCLSRQPTSAVAFDALATVYVQQARFEDARKLAGNFIKQNSADYRGYYFLAAGRDGDSLPQDETRALLKHSLELNPSFAASHALMGKVLLREDKPREAADSLRKAIQFRPDLVQAHLHLARALRLLGDEAGATQEFETVRKLKEKEKEPTSSLRYHRGTQTR